MKEFKVGDRVRVRGFGLLDGQAITLDGMKLAISSMSFINNQQVHVNDDAGNGPWIIFKSQCVRLKIKPRRRFWIHEKSISGFSDDFENEVYVCAKNAIEKVIYNKEVFVEFVEVRKKK